MINTINILFVTLFGFGKISKKEAEIFGKKSMKRNEKNKVVDYDKHNHDKYWS